MLSEGQRGLRLNEARWRREQGRGSTARDIGIEGAREVNSIGSGSGVEGLEEEEEEVETDSR